jgi:hypothetical protein
MPIQKWYTDGKSHLEICLNSDGTKLNLSIAENDSPYTFFSVDLDSHDLTHLIYELRDRMETIKSIENGK